VISRPPPAHPFPHPSTVPSSLPCRPRKHCPFGGPPTLTHRLPPRLFFGPNAPEPDPSRNVLLPNPLVLVWPLSSHLIASPPPWCLGADPAPSAHLCPCLSSCTRPLLCGVPLFPFSLLDASRLAGWLLHRVFSHCHHVPT
jgi:hypothetical protein